MRQYFLTVLLLIAGNLFSQDIHFSQFYSAYQNINPALTGTGSDPVRLGLLYRNQWNSIGTPYRTFTAFADSRFTFGKLTRTWFGVGLNAYNDRAGDGLLTNTMAMLSVSVSQGFNRYNTFLATAGFSLGFINRSVDVANLVFDEQWDGVKFDPNLANNEPLSTSSAFAPEFNFGVLITWMMNDNFSLRGGAAMYHINRPRLTFYDDDNRMEPKYVVHFSMEMAMNKDFTLKPSVFYSLQENVGEFIVGANGYYGKNVFKMVLGLWFRWNRDVIPAVGLYYGSTRFIMTYDINISALHPASGYRGGLELSLVQVIRKKRSRYPCSDFN